MPRLYVVAVGDKLPRWANEACDEYLKRLPRGYEALLFEVRAEPRTSGKSVEQMMAAEAKRLRAALPPGVRLIALDERGKDSTTDQFSTRLRTWLDSGVPRQRPFRRRVRSRGRLPFSAILHVPTRCCTQRGGTVAPMVGARGTGRYSRSSC